MRNETKLALLFSALVIILTGAVFAYLSGSNWPDIDSTSVNLHLIRANKNAQKTAATSSVQAVDYSDATMGISFQYPATWQADLDSKAADPILTLSSGTEKVLITKYANPKQRQTLTEYLDKKFSYKADVDFKDIAPLTVGGKEAYRLTMTNKDTAATYSQVWVKVSPTVWLAIGNEGAPQTAVDSIISSIKFLQ